MTKLFGEKFTKEELLRLVGEVSQVGGVRRYELSEGKEKGVEVIEFRTGSGFRFTVLPSRGMDISFAEYQGMALSWRSHTGEVAPQFFEPEGLGWLRGFYGGLLVTCGLTHMGSPCVDEGEALGLHGRFSWTPATNVSAGGKWEGDNYVIWGEGKVREAMVFNENICLTRKIGCILGESRLFLHDVIENLGYNSTPLMLLYHVNGGYPALSPGGRLIAPSLKVEPRDDIAAADISQWSQFPEPIPGFQEQVYFHDMAPDEKGEVTTALVNKKIAGGAGFGFYLKYRKQELPHFIQWKMVGEGHFVCGMEPANSLVTGRDKARAAGELPHLEPGEKKEYHLEIGVLTSREEIQEIEKHATKALGQGS
jgi:hypothetical protein